MPDEDQGYLYVSMQLPIAASMETHQRGWKTGRERSRKHSGVQYTTSVIGFNLLSFAPHQLQRFLLRYVETLGRSQEQSGTVSGNKTRLNQELSRLPQGTVFGFSPPAVPGVGTSGGFQFVLEDPRRKGCDVSFR